MRLFSTFMSLALITACADEEADVVATPAAPVLVPEPAQAAPADPRAARAAKEAAVVGQPAGDWDGVRWLGDAPDSLNDGATLLVFWEAWCPHCKKELPELAQLDTDWEDRGLDIVGLTRMSRNTTEEQVLSLVQSSGATFPQGHTDGVLSDRFAISGVPAAALVVDGTIVWRGHPARLDDATLKGLVEG